MVNIMHLIKYLKLVNWNKNYNHYKVSKKNIIIKYQKLFKMKIIHFINNYKKWFKITIIHLIKLVIIKIIIKI